MSDNPPEDQPQSDPARTEAGEVSVNTLAQYVKDLSFENPSAPNVVNDEQDAPAVDMDIRVDTEKVGTDTYEVALTMRATAVSGEKTLFLVDLTYCGVFGLSNVPQDQIAPILRIHCPMLLFPFARHIVADATRNGGYPPLLINLIDFAQLYQQRRRADRKGGEAKGAEEGKENGE